MFLRVVYVTKNFSLINQGSTVVKKSRINTRPISVFPHSYLILQRIAFKLSTPGRFGAYAYSMNLEIVGEGWS